MGEPPFLLADVCRNTETGRLLILLGGAGKEVGQDRAGDVVPHGEHGAGDGGQRILSKVGTHLCCTNWNIHLTVNIF